MMFGILAASCSAGANEGSTTKLCGKSCNESAPEPIHFVYKNDATGTDDNEYIYYTDDYFKSDSTTYNPHLATLSILMSKYSMNVGGPDSIDDIYWFVTQSERVSKFFEAIGFSNFKCNPDYISRSRFDSIGIAVASRKVDDFTLLACTVRSGGYFNEWENNVFLGDGSRSDMMHEGWYNAANKVIDFIGEYISLNNINGQIKLWMSGFSRGAATINLTAGLLDNKIEHDGGDNVYDGVAFEKEDLYAYTFETPSGANVRSETVEHAGSDIYNNIFNIVNPNDMVTKVAMERFGFTRFGIDKFITTEFFEPENYDSNRHTAKMLYGKNNEWPADRYTSYGIPFSKWVHLYDVAEVAADLVDWLTNGQTGDIPYVFEVDDTKKNYDPNILMTLVLDQVCEGMGNCNRNFYVDNVQDIARGLMRIAQADLKDPNAPSTGVFIAEIAFQALAYTLFNDESGIIDIVGLTGATSQQAGNLLSACIPLVENYPNELLTLAANAKDIFNNHSTDVNVSHIKAQDSYYIDAYNQSVPEDKLNLVPLRDSASFCRFHLYDFNDCYLTIAKDNYQDKKLEITGSSLEQSDVKYARAGYAAGYYHYASYERINVFCNAEDDVALTLAEYSTDWKHNCHAQYFVYRTGWNLGPYRYVETFYDQEVSFGIDPFTVYYKAGAPYTPPEPPRVTDLTNTTWTIDHLRIVSIEPYNVNFVDASGNNHHQISCDYHDNHYYLFYDGLEVANASIDDPETTPVWEIDNNMATITFIDGDDIRNEDLIDFMYRSTFDAQ